MKRSIILSLVIFFVFFVISEFFIEYKQKPFLYIFYLSTITLAEFFINKINHKKLPSRKVKTVESIISYSLDSFFNFFIFVTLLFAFQNKYVFFQPMLILAITYFINFNVCFPSLGCYFCKTRFSTTNILTIKMAISNCISVIIYFVFFLLFFINPLFAILLGLFTVIDSCFILFSRRTLLHFCFNLEFNKITIN